jgi:N-ethylmaleimide reductase
MPRPVTTTTLYDSIELSGRTLTNRVALAPMTRSKAGPDRLANPLMAEYYKQRAGAGLIITEATTVSAQGNGYLNTPGIYTDEQGEAWRQVTGAVHEAGGTIFLQLWHTGRASHSDFHDGNLPVSASAIRNGGDGVHTPNGKQEFETPRALRTDELPGIVVDYVTAARRAKAAGFDGVEVHAANGYLLDSFLQSRTNHRSDEYGGSAENRFRLLREIVTGVTEVFEPNRVAVRLAPNGVFNDMGSPDYRETFTYVARELGRFGLAYLHVMDGLAFGFHEQGEPMTLAEFRAVFSGPLMGNCGYDQESAEKAIANGDADMVSIGRPFITNPDLVARWQNGWAMADLSDPAGWYTLEQTPTGYTDYAPFKR